MPRSHIYTMLKCQLNSKRSVVLPVVSIIIVTSTAAGPPQPRSYLWKMGRSVGFRRLPGDSQVQLELRCPGLHDTCMVVTFGSDMIDEEMPTDRARRYRCRSFQRHDFPGPRSCPWWFTAVVDDICVAWGSPRGQVAGITRHSELCLCSCLLIPLPAALPLFWGASLLVCYSQGANSLCDTMTPPTTLPQHIPACVLLDWGRNSWRHPSASPARIPNHIRTIPTKAN